MLTEEERNAFKAAADSCVAVVEASVTSEEEPYEDESTDAFFELVAGLLEKYDDLSGIRYGGKTFIAEFTEDEDGVFISGIRWIEDQKLEVID